MKMIKKFLYCIPLLFTTALLAESCDRSVIEVEFLDSDRLDYSNAYTAYFDQAAFTLLTKVKIIEELRREFNAHIISRSEEVAPFTQTENRACKGVKPHHVIKFVGMTNTILNKKTLTYIIDEKKSEENKWHRVVYPNDPVFTINLPANPELLNSSLDTLINSLEEHGVIKERINLSPLKNKRLNAVFINREDVLDENSERLLAIRKIKIENDDGQNQHFDYSIFPEKIIADEKIYLQIIVKDKLGGPLFVKTIPSTCSIYDDRCRISPFPLLTMLLGNSTREETTAQSRPELGVTASMNKTVGGNTDAPEILNLNLKYNGFKLGELRAPFGGTVRVLPAQLEYSVQGIDIRDNLEEKLRSIAALSIEKFVVLDIELFRFVKEQLGNSNLEMKGYDALRVSYRFGKTSGEYKILIDLDITLGKKELVSTSKSLIPLAKCEDCSTWSMGAGGKLGAKKVKVGGNSSITKFFSPLDQNENDHAQFFIKSNVFATIDLSYLVNVAPEHILLEGGLEKIETDLKFINGSNEGRVRHKKYYVKLSLSI